MGVTMLFTALLAATAPGQALQPSGPWVVRAEDSMCLLARQYPVGNKRISLVFQPMLDLPSMEVFIVGEDEANGRQFTGEFTATFDPQPQAYTGPYFSVFHPKAKTRITRLSIGRVALDQARDGDTLAVKAKPVDLRFAIKRPDQAKVALKKCIDDLKLAWGIDPDAAVKTATELEGNPAAYFGTSSYPAAAYTKGIYGRVVALLNVDAAGAVSACRVLSSAGKELNEGTCKAAMRIKFKPARDIAGKPLPSTYILPVQWVLPDS